MPDTLLDLGPGSATRLSEREFQMISGLVRDRFGVNLTEKKKALVRGRLNSMVKAKGLSSFEELYREITEDSSGDGMLSLIDRISTNHSYFFRESDHFDYLTQTALPGLVSSRAGKSRKLRFWCAGCAAGEEPYTLAMVLSEFFGSDLARWDIGILGTDISLTARSSAVMALSIMTA